MRCLAHSRGVLFILAVTACSTSAPERAPSVEAERLSAPPSVDPLPVPSRGFPDAPFTLEPTLDNAAFKTGAPSAVVHASSAFDRIGPLHVVVVLHGWYSCARQLAYAGPTPCLSDGSGPLRPGYGLNDRFDETGSPALFVVAQLALWERSSSPGRFSDDGQFRRWLDELLGSLSQSEIEDVGSVTLLAHSAGYETALAILDHGEVPIRNVVLLDALYRGAPRFFAWVRADERRRLLSIFTPGARTADVNARLAELAGVNPIPLGGARSESIRRERVTILETRAAHGDVPAAHLAELLAPLGLAPSTLAAE